MLDSDFLVTNFLSDLLVIDTEMDGTVFFRVIPSFFNFSEGFDSLVFVVGFDCVVVVGFIDFFYKE